MQATDFHPQKVFCCPCLLNVLDNIFDSGFWSLDEIITHLQNLKKYRVDKKDLMTICNQRLKVAVIASFKYSCSSNIKKQILFLICQKNKNIFVQDV